MQFAQRQGCRVLRIGRGGSVEVNSVEDPDLKATLTLADGKGPDVVIDTVGDAKLVQASLKVLNSRGRFSFITAPRGPGGSVVPVDLMAVYMKEIELVGNNLVMHEQVELAEMLKGMVGGFEEGKLKALEEGKMESVGLEGGVEAYGNKERGNKFVMKMV